MILVVACACIAGRAWVGRMCGYLLAWSQLKRFGIAPPEHLASWTLHHADGKVAGDRMDSRP